MSAAASPASPASPAPELAPPPLPVDVVPTPSPTLEPPRPRPTASDGARARRAIRDARRLVASGDLPAALPRFEEALAAAPTARLRCETGYVAFRAGELARAEALIEEALVTLLPAPDPPPELRVPTAMCLYNAGLVREARGRAADARDAYERSSALRPNATVDTHLAALGPATLRPEPTWWSMPPTTSFDALASAIRDDACRRETEIEPGCEGVEVSSTPVPNAPLGIEAVLITVTSAGPYCSNRRDVLAVRASSTLWVRDLDTACAIDAHGWESPDEITARFEDVLPGGSPELVVALEIVGGDEPLDWRTSEWSQARTIVCTLDEGPLACVWLSPTSGSREFQSMEDDVDEADEAEEANDDEDVADNEGDGAGSGTSYGGYASTLRFEGGRAIFEPVPGYPDAPPRSTELRSLFHQPEGRWPDTWEPIE